MNWAVHAGSRSSHHMQRHNLPPQLDQLLTHSEQTQNPLFGTHLAAKLSTAPSLTCRVRCEYQRILKGTAAICVSTSDKLAVSSGRSCATRWSGLSRDCSKSSNTAAGIHYATHTQHTHTHRKTQARFCNDTPQALQTICGSHAATTGHRQTGVVCIESQHKDSCPASQGVTECKQLAATLAACLLLACPPSAFSVVHKALPNSVGQVPNLQQWDLAPGTDGAHIAAVHTLQLQSKRRPPPPCKEVLQSGR
jgi:hypothetical protein